MYRTGKMRTSVSAAVALSLIAGVAMSASAQVSEIVSIPPFTGESSELWLTSGGPCPSSAPCLENGVFGGQGQLCTFNKDTGAPTNGGHVAIGWGAGLGCTIHPYVPDLLYASASGIAEYSFAQPVGRFGGYFGAITSAVVSANGGIATFYDEQNVEIGQALIPISSCGVWAWHGWEFSVPVMRIRVASNAHGGAFLMMDAMEMALFSSGSPCYADCDERESLNVDDFTCFINAFAAASALPHEQQVDHYANCDGSTAAPVLNVNDFICFINAYAQGCP
jgi:hypothetical protein